MIALGPAAAREADARTIAAGTPGIVLMERAAEAVARECLRAVAGVPLRGERVVVLCGTGNNGGTASGRPGSSGGVRASVRCRSCSSVRGPASRATRPRRSVASSATEARSSR